MKNKDINLDKCNSLLYGNGFAFDVYLPALIKLGIKKILIDKNQFLHKDKTNILNKYNEYIIYYKDESYKKPIIDYTILAVPPSNQYKLLLDNNFFENTKTLILEKPLALSPVKALDIMQKLEKISRKYIINYSFRYTLWYRNISAKIKNLPNNVELIFIWKFMARHFIHKRNTWKRFHSEGGGAIRFYGIHMIAILSDIGYLKVRQSNNLSEKYSYLSSFSCSFESTQKLPKCKILINSKSLVNEFSCYYIKDNKRISLLNLDEPFPKGSGGLLEDPRIDLTKRLIDEENFNYSNFNVIKLWKDIEDKIQ